MSGTGYEPPKLIRHLFPRLLGQSQYNARLKAAAPLMEAALRWLAGWAGYGYCPSHSRWYWGAKLLLICTCDGTVTGFCLANPSLRRTRAGLGDDHGRGDQGALIVLE
jgi:hypothetical protein